MRRAVDRGLRVVREHQKAARWRQRWGRPDPVADQKKIDEALAAGRLRVVPPAYGAPSPQGESR